MFKKVIIKIVLEKILKIINNLWYNFWFNSKIITIKSKRKNKCWKGFGILFFKVETKICKLEGLPTKNELHVFQIDKERKENRKKITDLKYNINIKEIEIGNKDFIGKKEMIW